MSGWTWKPRDARGEGLLYEPGNWGDILKALWVRAVMRYLVRVWGRDVEAVDPFAGAPDYDLPAASRRRLDRVEVDGALFAPFLDAGRWPSAAALLSASLPEGASPVICFDLDSGKRSRFCGDARFATARGPDGWAVAAERRPGSRGLLLLDPYDFLHEWKGRLDDVLAASAETNVLLYVYNRSARDPERLRDYRTFRHALADAWGEAPMRVGRVPADGFLAAAHHEVVWLPGPELCTRHDHDELLRELEQRAIAVDGAVRHSGVIEP
jgi:hypothetical protein